MRAVKENSPTFQTRISNFKLWLLAFADLQQLALHTWEDNILIMPVFKDTYGGYIQWQRCKAKQVASADEAIIDVTEHCSHLKLTGSKENQITFSNSNHDFAEDFPRADLNGKTKKLTPRGVGNHTAIMRDANSLGRNGGVFTEGISSLSRRSPFPLSLERTDIVSQNLPDNVKIAKEKNRMYVALSQPSSRQSRDFNRVSNKENHSARSVRTLPPPSSCPWSEILSVTEMTRAKTFTLDHRVRALDSGHTASNNKVDKTIPDREEMQFPIYYPSVTGVPPNTPLNMPVTCKRKVPSVNIVSLGGKSVKNIGTTNDSRPRLPDSFRGFSQYLGPLQGKGNMGTVTTFKRSFKPGIDLPHLPLRYAGTRNASFQFCREQPVRISYNAYKRNRRHADNRQLKKKSIVKSDSTVDLTSRDQPEKKMSTNDPYANRFRQVSSVMSVGDIVPSLSATSHNEPVTDNENKTVLLLEPTVMVTVHEDDEGKDDGSQTEKGAVVQSEKEIKETEKHAYLEQMEQHSGRVRNRTQSIVSNASLLSVPNISNDLSDARPPNKVWNIDDADTVLIDIATLPISDDGKKLTHPHFEPEVEHVTTSPHTIASTSIINTARTIATQTTIPFDSDVLQRRDPNVLQRRTIQIKTLSMFPDITTSTEATNGLDSRVSRTVTNEPLLRMSHTDSHGEMKVLGLSELCTPGQNENFLEKADRADGSKCTSNGVQNITFISPLEVHQKAKRFWFGRGSWFWRDENRCSFSFSN